MLDFDLIERHLEFLGDEHGNSRLDTLPHLDLRHCQEDLAAPIDADETVWHELTGSGRHLNVRRHRTAGPLRRNLATRRQCDADQQAAARRRAENDAEFQKMTARHPLLGLLMHKRGARRFDRFPLHLNAPSRHV
jgi:hypothetical protein